MRLDAEHPVDRLQDLELARDRALSLTRSWSVMHALDEGSPLYQATPESLLRDEAELKTRLAAFLDEPRLNEEAE